MIKKILLIDDYESILYSLSMILENQGYEVHSLTCFSKAAQYLKQSTPDLIISEFLTNEDINGIDFYFSHAAPEKLPISIYTNHFNHLAKDPEYFYFMVKPYLSEGKISVLIENALSKVYYMDNKYVLPVFCKVNDVEIILDYYNGILT